MTPAAPGILVIGDAHLDVTARPTAPIRPGADVPAAVRVGPGGQGANLAVRLARLGLGVDLVCGLGDDPAGKLLADALHAEGVGLHPVPVEATGMVLITLDGDGERTMMSQRSAFAAAAAIADHPAAEWIVLSGYVLTEGDAAGTAAALAARNARRVVVGCAVPAQDVTAWRQAVAAARPDILIVNGDEATAFAPLEELSGGVVVTGNDVVTASIGDAAVRIAVDRDAEAVDTTGVGDAFAAALMGGLCRVAWPPGSAVLGTAVRDAARLAAEVAGVGGAQARVRAESLR